MKLPGQSVVLNKWKPDMGGDIEWISDGYALLDPSGLETEENEIMDSIRLILGEEGTVTRDGREFEIKKSILMEIVYLMPSFNKLIRQVM